MKLVNSFEMAIPGSCPTGMGHSRWEPHTANLRRRHCCKKDVTAARWVQMRRRTHLMCRLHDVSQHSVFVSPGGDRTGDPPGNNDSPRSTIKMCRCPFDQWRYSISGQRILAMGVGAEDPCLRLVHLHNISQSQPFVDIHSWFGKARTVCATPQRQAVEVHENRSRKLGPHGRQRLTADLIARDEVHYKRLQTR